MDTDIIQRLVLPFLSISDVNIFMRCCKSFHTSVSRTYIGDTTTKITHITEWNRTFPNAKKIKVTVVNLPDINILSKIRYLHLIKCSLSENKLIQLFSNIHKLIELDISECKTITDEAFSHLSGIHKLDMRWCDQITITDKAFSHLSGIHTLDMSGCNQQ